MASGPDANTTSHMIPALVIALCSGGGSGECGGGRAASCCGGCVAWRSRSWSHGLMMAVAGGGGGGRGRVTEAAAVVSRRVAVAA
jgi:hypothetical protein